MTDYDQIMRLPLKTVTKHCNINLVIALWVMKKHKYAEQEHSEEINDPP